MTIAEIMIFTLILVLAGTAVLYWRHKSASSSVQVVNLFLTMRLNPEEQKEIIQWLNQRFAKDDLGQIIADEGSGYLTNQNGEIIACDFDIQHPKMNKAKFEAILQNLNKVSFFTKGSYLKYQDKKYPIGDAVVLAVYLKKQDFTPEEFSDQALNTLIEKLCNALDKNCRYFSFWQDGKTTALYFYGKDYAVMQQIIEKQLPDEPLCKNSTAVQIPCVEN